MRQIEAVRLGASASLPRRSILESAATKPAPNAGPPRVLFLDLPVLPSEAATTGLRLAVWSKPWKPVTAYSSASGTGFAPRLDIAEPAIIGTVLSALGSGAAGLLDTRQTVTVKLTEGTLQSVSDAQLYAGANACAVKSASGVWEVLQFQNAVETAADTWQISGLLRGQLGTTDAAAAGALAGAEFVLLDSAVRNCGLTLTESENGLDWKIGPAGAPISKALFDTSSSSPASRALVSNAPVHLNIKRNANSDAVLSFIRCGRADADIWDDPEIPLPEMTERYRLRILTSANLVKREATLATPEFNYTNAMKLADFGSGINPVTFEIAQLNAGGRPGRAARQTSLL